MQGEGNNFRLMLGLLLKYQERFLKTYREEATGFIYLGAR